MTNARIEELVTRLRGALEEIDWLGRKIFPRLRAPATDDEIAAAAKHWDRDLPPSYEAFLRLTNGIEGADQYDWAIAGTSEPTRGESFEDVKAGHIYAFGQKQKDHPVVKDLESSAVAGSDFDYQVVYFEPSTLGDEEPKLRRVGLDTGYDGYPLFADFAEFLEFVVEIYEDLVSFQNQPLDDPGGGGSADEQLIRELAALLGDARSSEPEPPPPPKLSPEMELASKLCNLTLTKLIDRELVELVDAPGCRENLEDYMLRKLLRSKSPKETIDAWITALDKAREVEELFGTDDELAAAMMEAFEEISEQAPS